MTGQLPLFGSLDRLIDRLIDRLGGQVVLHLVSAIAPPGEECLV